MLVIKNDAFSKCAFLYTGRVSWLVVLFCLVVFYGVSTLFGSFNAELNFKQFSLAWVSFLFTTS